MKPPSSEVKMSLKRAIKEGDSEVTDSKKAKIDVNSQCFTLNSGQSMPVVQFGTYKMKGEECYQATLAALKGRFQLLSYHPNL